MSDELTSPITAELRLRCSAEHAFTAYTARIGEWWHPRYTANPETLEGVTIEPRVGGRVYATHRDSGEHHWGDVTEWEPGRRLVHTFSLAQDPRHPSEIAVDFVANGEGCAMRFAHGGWTSANAAVKRKFGDWRVLLDRFVSLAEADR